MLIIIYYIKFRVRENILFLCIFFICFFWYLDFIIDGLVVDSVNRLLYYMDIGLDCIMVVVIDNIFICKIVVKDVLDELWVIVVYLLKG